MNKEHKYRHISVLGALLAVGLMLSAFILGHQFKNFQQSGVITVKGLAQAQYKASLGTWKISIDTWAETYQGSMDKNQVTLETVYQFLKEQGFSETEYQVTPIDVSTHEEEYQDEQGKYRTRKDGFDAERSINISTTDLTKLQNALTQIQNIRAINQDISFKDPKYYLDDLEKIKRELIAKATQDAYVRAQEFAKTSNVKVGILRSASQGSFDIESTTPDNNDRYYGGSYDTSTIDKMVRLVVTIQYAIN